MAPNKTKPKAKKMTEQNNVQTLNQFIIQRQAEYPNASGELSRMLHHIGIASKIVNRAVNKAGLVDVLELMEIKMYKGKINKS